MRRRLWSGGPLASLRTRLGYPAPGDIDAYIASVLHRPQLTHFYVHTQELPHYRFVDVYRVLRASARTTVTCRPSPPSMRRI